MNRITQIDPASATGKAKLLLDAVKSKLGIVPNMTRVMANAPAALEGYLEFSGALAKGSLSVKVREQIALAVAEINLCSYCLSAHTFIGGKQGLTNDEIADARHANSSDASTDAILRFVRSVVIQRGEVGDADLAVARSAGLSDGQIVETIANVALNVFTNYVNRIANTVLDFPEVSLGNGYSVK